MTGREFANAYLLFGGVPGLTVQTMNIWLQGCIMKGDL
jgi:hypothetical protein